MSDGQLEQVTYPKDSAPVEVRDLAHMISPTVYPEVRICVIFIRTYEIDECSLFMPFHVLLVYRSLLPKITYCTCKLHCLPNNIYCTELCVYHGDFQNISKIVVDNNGDDANLD
jgi:hypothetical protein